MAPPAVPLIVGTDVDAYAPGCGLMDEVAWTGNRVGMDCNMQSTGRQSFTVVLNGHNEAAGQ
jgi:hypothetical protein